VIIARGLIRERVEDSLMAFNDLATAGADPVAVG
jgi:hypothetical protein